MNNEHTPGHPEFVEAHGGKTIPLGHREGLIDLTVTVNGTTTRLDPPVFSTTDKADLVDVAAGDGFIARALRHRRATENGPL
ncbi:hypothetical protein [Rhodococcus sp. 077-4]|uniref:hypothetical protein n=1 Tax=Rhodococcus sp. 077-4 TaxID=2789271 RepID=UPI0039F477FD